MPEDDPNYIPEMPENYGHAYLEGKHRNIEEMTEGELASHDLRNHE